MTDETVLDAEFIEEEPLSIHDLLAHVIQDVCSDAEPEQVADEFVSEFVVPARPEMDTILQLLDQPTPLLVAGLKTMVQQTATETQTIIDSRGTAFAEGLKTAVRERLKSLAATNKNEEVNF